jgi:hypothetical protein
MAFNSLFLHTRLILQSCEKRGEGWFVEAHWLLLMRNICASGQVMLRTLI